MPGVEAAPKDETADGEAAPQKSDDVGASEPEHAVAAPEAAPENITVAPEAAHVDTTAAVQAPPRAPPVAAPFAPAPEPPPPDSRMSAFVQLLWASFLGASAVLMILGIIITLDKARIIDFDDHIAIGLGTMIVLPVILAMTVGFQKPARGISRIIGRILGVTFMGGLLFGGLALLLAYLDDAFGLSNREVADLAIAGGLALTVIGIVRARRARRSRPAEPRIETMTGERKAAPYLWAGAFAAAILMWCFAMIIALEAAHLFNMGSSATGPLMLLLGAFAVILAASRAYPRHLRIAVPFGSRFFLTLVAGALAGLMIVISLIPIVAAFNPTKGGMATITAVYAIALIAAALVRGRGILREARSGRVEGLVIAAALIGLFMWPQSAWLRYALGSAEGSRVLAIAHYKREEYARAAVFAETACDRGDARSCAMAAELYKLGLGVPTSLQRARDLVASACRSPEVCLRLANDVPFPASRDLLLSRACELGDRGACARARRDMLSRRCDSRDAFACRALVSFAEETGDRSLDVRSLYEKACAFGDTTACPARPSR
jgi:hypothetical protein